MKDIYNQVVAWELQLDRLGLLDEARSLRDGLYDPETSSVEDFWYLLWTKPLYANTRVEVAERCISKLSPYMTSAWKTIGTGQGVLDVEKLDNKNSDSSFTGVGNLFEFSREKPKISKKRLYIIQNGAAALRHWMEITNGRPFERIKEVSLSIEGIESLRSELGYGWGHITIMHFLTDLGLAVKPDIHLCKTVGLLKPDLATTRIASMKKSLEINSFVKELSTMFEMKNSLRYVDKLLMDVSRKNLI